MSISRRLSPPWIINISSSMLHDCSRVNGTVFDALLGFLRCPASMTWRTSVLTELFFLQEGGTKEDLSGQKRVFFSPYLVDIPPEIGIAAHTARITRWCSSADLVVLAFPSQPPVCQMLYCYFHSEHICTPVDRVIGFVLQVFVASCTSSLFVECMLQVDGASCKQTNLQWCVNGLFLVFLLQLTHLQTACSMIRWCKTA